MAKATSKKQNNRADPLSKKGKKDASKADVKASESSQDPKSSHLCKRGLPHVFEQSTCSHMRSSHVYIPHPTGQTTTNSLLRSM
jgi:hypothetical protein